MATKRQRRKRRRRVEDAAQSPKPVAPEPAAAPAPARAARRSDGPPPAPWGSFPLSELVVFIALILLVAGFVVPPPRGAIMLGAGLVLGSLAGLELAVREHFAGYKSHTLLLAGAIGVPVVAALYFLGAEAVGRDLPIWVCLLGGLVAFGIAAWAFAGAFRRRSGGELFKFRA